MTYKPPVAKGSGFGPRGKAKVQVKGDKVRVVLHEIVKDSDEEVEHTVVLDKENCPDAVRPGQWYVSLSSDKKKMFNLHPINGMFTVHVQKFSAKKDEQPAPRVHQGAYGDWYTFTPILEFLDEEVAGMTVGYDLPYNFEAIKENIKGEMKDVAGISHPKSKYTEKLLDFLEATGVWKYGPLAWQDNLCPKLEQRMLKADQKFKVIVKQGYIDTLYQESELPEDEVPSSEDADEESPF